MWETIKQILKKNHGTCIIVEEGKPVYVVTSFDDYQKILENQPTLDNPLPIRFKEGLGEAELLEKINQEIIGWKAKQTQINPEIEAIQEEDLKIEDLPLV
jgi:hypothetical protein